MIRFLYLGMVFCGMVICLMSQSSAQNQKTKSPKGVAIANQGTPVIDAEIDDSWKKCPKFRVNQPIAELLEIDAKEMATATVRLLWDEKHLYVLWLRKNCRKTGLVIRIQPDFCWLWWSVVANLDGDLTRQG